MKFILASLSLIFLLGYFYPIPTVAQSNDLIGLEYAAQSGLPQTELRTSVARIINAVLGVLGILTTIIMLYAGFQWMTARGDSGKAEEAQRTIYMAIIGLIILLSAYAISTYVVSKIYSATAGRPYPTSPL